MRKDCHHRLPKSFGGKRDKGNLSKVPRDKHQMFHQLFSTEGRAMTSEEIANQLNTVWCDPNVKFVVVTRGVTPVWKKFYPNRESHCDKWYCLSCKLECTYLGNDSPVGCHWR
jgi:hypothetical protein